jgi:type IV pilus assembly protein PilE
MYRNNRGFSLTELLVTLAVVAVITAIAVPSYRQYVMRASRADAKAAILRVAGNQERFYLANNTYASDALLDDPPPAGLGIPGTERGFYDLAIVPHDDGLTVGYTATATAIAGEDQADDEDCAVFRVTEQGVRTADNADGDDNTEACWR